MNALFKCCGYYCGFLASIGIFFFLFLLVLAATNSLWLHNFLELPKSFEESQSVAAMGLAMGVSYHLINQYFCFFSKSLFFTYLNILYL